MISFKIAEKAGDFGAGSHIGPATFAGHDLCHRQNQRGRKITADRKRTATLQDIGQMHGLFFPDEPDDFRHRMTMNALGLAVTVALVVTGIWIADVMAHMRKDQDCVLTGRPGCTHVDVPIQPR